MTSRAGTAPVTTRGSRSTDPRGRTWILLALTLMVVGALGSVVAARTIAGNDNRTSRQVFTASSAEITTALNMAILHEQDLVVAAGAFAVRNPGGSQRAFVQWTTSIRAFDRYPELRGIGELSLVPADQLDTFSQRAAADPIGPVGPAVPLVVSPPGARADYCLETASVSRTGQPTAPVGTDFCATGGGPMLLQSRDTGSSAYLPVRTGTHAGLILGTPVYANNVVPTTVTSRRASFIGWTATEIDPTVILDAALAGSSGTSIKFRYGDGSSTDVFAAGTSGVPAQSETQDLHNGWTASIVGAATSASIVSRPDALAVLLCGLAVSLLLGILIETLGASRARAVRLVDTRNGQLHHQAFHDGLTGLPNRALILDRIDQMMARARREPGAIAVLCVDIDGFKEINGSLGKEAGDEVLKRVGTRLSQALRDGDTIGRVGGDEFVLLVEGASLAAGADVVADRILDIMDTPFVLAGRPYPLQVTVSIGIATGTRAQPNDLLRDARTALDRAKALGRHRAVVFRSSMHDAAESHRALEQDLRSAVAHHEFFLVYQPTVDLASGVFTGAEALLRWRHPQRGVVRPDEFIGTLEQTGLIVPVGRWVLEEACRQGAAWHAQGCRLAVSVNIAGQQLRSPRILDDVNAALSDSGFAPTSLILELTETTLMHDVAAIVGQLDSLKAVGVRIAIDDFGTGYSSLAYLRQFPIDVLKIDQSFVAGVADSTESAAIVHTLVQLGKLLGLQTIAEGIETEDQRSMLAAEGVDIGQGYLFARPLDVGAVDRLLRNRVSADRPVDVDA